MSAALLRDALVLALVLLLAGCASVALTMPVAPVAEYEDDPNLRAWGTWWYQVRVGREWKVEGPYGPWECFFLQIDRAKTAKAGKCFFHRQYSDSSSNTFAELTP